MKKTETVAALLQKARKSLFEADIELSALDARLLLQVASGLSHEMIVAEPDLLLSHEQICQFKNFINRRLAHEPVSRILQLREFYGRPFQITKDVLDPRADTETVIELALELMGDGFYDLLDIGTGSGAIAITLLAERPQLTGIAVDVSENALHVAKQNALANGVSGRLKFHQGTWFQGLTQKFDLIISNPPYIPHGEIAGLESEVKDHDPHLALDGGHDGLFAYRAIASGLGAHLNDQGLVIVEIGAGQGDAVKTIFAGHGFETLKQKLDLGGHMRALAFGRAH